MSRRPLLLSCALLLTACGASAPTDGQAQDSMSDAEFDRRLREALMREPEVIIEAIEAYRAQIQADAESASREAIADVLPELIDASSGFAMGASVDDAEIVVIEFFDYHCGFCKRALGDVMALTEDDSSVRVVFQDFPILREESRNAAIAAATAAELGPDVYSEVHTALMAADGVLTDDSIKTAFKNTSLNMRSWSGLGDAEQAAAEAKITRSEELGRQVGVGGTPYFIVIGTQSGSIEILEGYRPDLLQTMIANAKS